MLTGLARSLKLEAVHRRVWAFRQDLRMVMHRLGGGPPRSLDPRQVCYHKTRNRTCVTRHDVWCHDRVAVVLALGQSNLANEGEAGALYCPARGVYNFNLFNNRIYEARDPLLGTSCNRSNLLTRLGDLLVRRGVYDSVLLVPLAHGGSFATDWVEGGEMFPRLALTLRALLQQNISPTHVLWHQGEAESNHMQNCANAWKLAFRSVVAHLRRNGVAAPVYVAKSTICCGPRNEAIRAAQFQVVDVKAGVFEGPDTDTIGIDARWDGCHFSREGLERGAELWYSVLTRASVGSESGKIARQGHE